MPLSSLQIALLQLLAKNRNPESYVAGAVAINRDGPRYSRDIDIFHDSDERLAATAEEDAATIQRAGYRLTWTEHRAAGKRSALVEGNGETAQLDWVADSDFRFFPVIADDLFGYVLHPVDLATNKAAAAADRRVPRDIVDLLTIDARILPLGAVIWAACGRFPGQTPEQMLSEIVRHSRFTAEEFRSLAVDKPLDIQLLAQQIRTMCEAADAFIHAMPSEAAGCVFLRDGKFMQPDPGLLETYEWHRGARRGHWPTSVEIGRAMLQRHTE